MEEGIKEVVEYKVPDLTRGEKLVGVKFNPSGDDEVATVKRACAYLIDIMDKHLLDTPSSDKKIIVEHAITEVINAQMNVVKAITYQD
jgi:hypothetical protein